MHRGFRRRQAEDQPSAAGVDVLEAQHIGQERAIGIRVGAEDDDMRSIDHAYILSARNSVRWMERVDVLVVGGGIVGLATARAVMRAHPGRSVTVIEKEGSVATHQSGRNSGVIHAGVYYAPGSEKARLCVAGRTSMVEYCQDHGIEHAVCGKVVVARDADDSLRLHELERRCTINGVKTEMIGRDRLREIEPHVAGIAALHVLETGVVDYAHVCRALAAEIEAAGATIRLECSVISGSEQPAGLVVETTQGPIEAQRVVTCAGLHADEVAQMISGPEGSGDLRVIAFRGEYRELAPTRSHLVRTLIYPVPDPQFPFLGVHLTRGVDGTVHVGPERCARARARGLHVARGRLRAPTRHVPLPRVP